MKQSATTLRSLNRNSVGMKRRKKSSGNLYHLPFSTPGPSDGIGLAIHVRNRNRLKRLQSRRYWMRPWLRRRDSGSHSILHLYSELLIDGDIQELRATLRMDRELYHGLLEKLRPAISKRYTNFRRCISPEVRLALTMRFLAFGEPFRTLSQAFRVGLSTSRVIVLETCQAIRTVMGPEYLVTPSTTEEWVKVAGDFHKRWNFPHCIGSVDGKHIRITQPRKSGSYFHNYKDYFSIVLMAVASADYKFLYVDVGSEGKASDGGIWAKCSLYEYFTDHENPLNLPQSSPLEGKEENLPYVLVADDAFPLGPSLLKPYPGSVLTQKQQIFNYRLSRSRRTVENVFEILSCRFRIFRKTIELNPSFVEEIVMATCILHNFLREHAKSDYTPPGTFDQELENGNMIPGAWRLEEGLGSMRKSSQRNASSYAKRKRDAFANYFLSKEGELPWQYDNLE